jgi:AraC-like DNA-binding protein
VQFHANFLCVETFHAEVGCSGTPFNDPYGVTAVKLDGQAKAKATHLIDRIRREHDERGLAYGEVMLARPNVLLVLATRLTASRAGACGPAADPRHPALAARRELIERNHRSLHSSADYAERLHVTPKTLGRIVREHLGTTPANLIRSRILTHAKWQLLRTLKPGRDYRALRASGRNSRVLEPEQAAHAEDEVALPESRTKTTRTGSPSRWFPCG